MAHRMAEKPRDPHGWDLPGICPLGHQEKVCVGRCHSSELTVKSPAGAPEETIHKAVARWWYRTGKLSKKMLGEDASHWALQELKEPLL